MEQTGVGYRPRRLAVLVAFLLALSIASSCSCPNGPGDDVTPGPSPAQPPSPAASPAVTPIAGGLGTLYAWANPLAVVGQFADHTWATSYDAPGTCAPQPRYWFSWGSCHATGPDTTGRALGSAPADLGLARCICEPDVESYSYTAEDPAHGGIDYYGISGVCHQLSNRILFSTSVGGADPLTVKGAHGYRISRWAYGTYGPDTAEWAARKSRCLAAAAAASPTPAAAMMRMASPTMTLDEDLRAMFGEQFHGDYSRASFEQVLTLRRSFLQDKQRLDRDTLSGRLPRRQYAQQVNELLNGYLVQLAGVLGDGNYRTLFGVPPREPIGLVDPEIAARSEPQR
jgi:hypothetical protein